MKKNLLQHLPMHYISILLVFIFCSCFVNAQDPVSYIKKNQIDKLEDFIEKGGDLSQTYLYIREVEDSEIEVFQYLISYALAFNEPEIFEFLLREIKTLPNFKEQISSCLTQLVSNNDLTNLKKLVELGADINYKCSICDDRAPILQAIAGGNLEMTEYVFSLNPDLSVVDNDGLNILYYAILGGRYDLFSDFVKNPTYNIWAGDPENNLLFIAAEADNTMFLSDLYSLMKDDSRFNINVEDSSSFTPLIAASYSSLKNLKFLIENGADVRHQDIEGYNALHYAAASGKSDMVEYLLTEFNFDPNAITNDEYNPMLLAVESEDITTVKLIAKNYDGTFYKTVLKTAKRLDDKTIYLYLKPLLKY